MSEKKQSKTYKKLPIDFELPPFIEKDINDMMEYVNNGGKFPDCHITNLDCDLKECENWMSEAQVKTIRDYYCRGGVGFHG